jgi:signal peptidase II
MERSERSNAPLYWGVIVTVVLLDVVTKWLAVRHLTDYFGHVRVLGDWVRLTLVYNPGAAFGLHLGPYSRWIFTALTIGALVILWRLLQATRAGDTPRTLAIALVTSGAIGNLIDRLRSSQGVVDFLDVGIGDRRWPTFNVADMAVSGGAFLLAWVLWREEREAEEAERRAALARTADDATGGPAAPASAAAPLPAPGAEPRDVA